MSQVDNAPDLRIDVDRTMADQIGLTQKDVASDLLVSLSGSGQTSPNFWVNPKNGVNYSILVQTPQYRMNSTNALENTPVVPVGANITPDDTQLIGNLAGLRRSLTPTNVTHYNIQRTVDVLRHGVELIINGLGGVTTHHHEHGASRKRHHRLLHRPQHHNPPSLDPLPRIAQRDFDSSVVEALTEPQT
jgi:plasmid maintenance system antidote protein VapI